MRSLPALKVVIFLAVGITLELWLHLPVIFSGIGAGLTLIASVVLDKRLYGQFFLIASVILTGAFSLHCNISEKDFPSTNVKLTGRILEPPSRYKNFTSFPMKVHHFYTARGNVFRGSAKIRVKIKENCAYLEAGQVVEVAGELNPFADKRNPGEFNFKAWFERNGFTGFLQADAEIKPVVINNSLPIIYKTRKLISLSIEKHFTSDDALVKALLLGFRRDLEPELVESLRNTGLSHLLALSGLHVGFLTAILFGFGTILRLSWTGRSLLSIFFLILFILLVPSRPSTVRAVVMAIVFLSASPLRRWSPPANSLAFAGLIILCFRPADLFDAGFQLSFTAIGGIILFADLIENSGRHWAHKGSPFRRRMRLYVLKPFLVSAAVSLLTLPLISYYFGIMPFLSPIFNLLAVPLLSIVYAGSWLTVVMSMISPLFAGIVADGITVVIFIWKELAFFFNTVTITWQYTLAPITVILIISLILWSITGSGKARFRTSVVFISILILILGDINLSSPRSFQAWFLDVGQGDAAIWLFPDGKTVLVDGGSVFSQKSNTIKRALDHFNRDRIDLLVASHPEADHIGGLIKVVEQFPVYLAICSPVKIHTATFDSLCEVSRRKQIKWLDVREGDKIDRLAAGYSLDILNPPVSMPAWSANDLSVVLALNIETSTGESLRLLSTGDIEQHAEQYLVRNADLAAALLKVPHHGSSTSCSAEFINSVKPAIAVISRGNRYEATGIEVLQRLENAGCEIHQTLNEGAVLCRPDWKNNHFEWKAVDWRNPPLIKWLFGFY